MTQNSKAVGFYVSFFPCTICCEYSDILNSFWIFPCRNLTQLTLFLTTSCLCLRHCRRTELTRRGVKVRRVWEIGRPDQRWFLKHSNKSLYSILCSNRLNERIRRETHATIKTKRKRMYGMSEYECASEWVNDKWSNFILSIVHSLTYLLLHWMNVGLWMNQNESWAISR